MKRPLKLLSTIVSSSIAISVPLLTICSCNVQNPNPDITKINLYPDYDTIRPGESVSIRAVVEPTKRRTNDLLWELVDCEHSQISINDIGVVTVENDFVVEELEEITIRATAKNNPEVTSTTTLSVLPHASFDFQGFEGNEVRYLDRDQKICSTQIKQNGAFDYVAEKNIDLFEMDTREHPKPFVSFIDFKPIIASQSTRYMSFELKKNRYSSRGITWFGYDEGSWTLSIPDFITTNPNPTFETIIVHFACDPRITLTINFNLWLNPLQQKSETLMTYVSDEPGDIHNIQRIEENVYETSIYCPAFAKDGTYTSSLSSIYCFNPPLEYLDYQFTMTWYPQLHPDLKEMMTVVDLQPKLYERSFDHFRYYQLDLNYSFKLTGRKIDANYFHFNKTRALTITLTDPFIPGYSASIRVFVDWI